MNLKRRFGALCLGLAAVSLLIFFGAFGSRDSGSVAVLLVGLVLGALGVFLIARSAGD